MTELLTSRQMRAIEQAEIASGAVTGLQLMERAGRGALAAAFARWPELVRGDRRAMILCGAGNNGGDGFVIARRLRDLGWTVDLFLFGAPDRLPPDAKTNHDLWAEMGAVRPIELQTLQGCPRPDLFVDAVFGTGLTKPLPVVLTEVLDVALMQAWPDGDRIRRLAVDCPSGLNLDTGTVPRDDLDGSLRHCNRADLTVSFHSLKVGHKLAEGPALCGCLQVVDIGLRGPDAAERSRLGGPPDPARLRLVEPRCNGADIALADWPGRVVAKLRETGHKYDFGHAMVMAGGVGKGGAARMAARAALRSGAGLVTLLCPPAALQENACHLDAIMLHTCADAKDLDTLLDPRVSALCLGPGMGTGAGTRALVSAALAHRTGKDGQAPASVVLDADALTSFADDPDELFAITHEKTVLTPHEGEFARLFPDLSPSPKTELSKVEAARRAADRAGCILLLKGPDSVIARPGGGASLHSATGPDAVPWLATAGAGDVLAGLIAGLAAPARSADLFAVVEAAVWLHVRCARRFGPGLIAEDLAETLPDVLQTLV